MSKITDAEANATSLDGLVNDNALVPTLRNGPKPSYQYLVDGWNNEFDLTLDQYKESRGFNTKGTFADGFTYELPNDVGLDASGNPWILIDTSSLPVIVSAGTTPSNPPYKQVSYGTASQVSTNTSDTVQSFVDSFALKIFQSPTGSGLTEIQTRTVVAGEVYEVRKTSDDSLATIYSDASGTTEIVQNGTSNVSGSAGVVEFYIADGDYYVEAGGVKSNFTGIVKATNVETSDGRNVQERLDDLPSEVDAAGTAATLISQHNSDATAHPELSAFITAEADRAETAAGVAMTAGWVYTDVPRGESARADGDYFWVVSADESEVLELWLMGTTTATDTGKRTLSSKAALRGIGVKNYWKDIFFRYASADGNYFGKSRFKSEQELTIEGNPYFTIGNSISKTYVTGVASSILAGPIVIYDETDISGGDTITVSALITSSEDVKLSTVDYSASENTLGVQQSSGDYVSSIAEPTLFQVEHSVNAGATYLAIYPHSTPSVTESTIKIHALWVTKGTKEEAPKWPLIEDAFVNEEYQEAINNDVAADLNAATDELKALNEINNYAFTYSVEVSSDSESVEIQATNTFANAGYGPPFSGCGVLLTPAGVSFNALRADFISRPLGTLDANKWDYIKCVVRTGADPKAADSTVIAVGSVKVPREVDTLENVEIILTDPSSGEVKTITDSDIDTYYMIGFYAEKNNGDGAVMGVVRGILPNRVVVESYYTTQTANPITHRWRKDTNNPSIGFTHLLLGNPQYQTSYKPTPQLVSDVDSYGYVPPVPIYWQPPKLYAVQDFETSVYFDGLIADDYENYNWDVSGIGIGRQQNERWLQKSSGTIAGSSVTISAFEKVAAGKLFDINSVLTVCSSNAGNGLTKNVLVIGDSLVNAGVITGTLLNNAGTDAMGINLIGTRGTAPNLHEGRGGWNITSYATQGRTDFEFTVSGVSVEPAINSTEYTNNGSTFRVQEVNLVGGSGTILGSLESGTVPSASGTLTKSNAGVGDETISFSASQEVSQNPFWINGQLDFQAYLTNNGFAAPDIVFIMLGVNDVFGQTSDAGAELRATTQFNHLDNLIANIQLVAGVDIAIIPVAGPSSDQDGFGQNYSLGQTQWRVKRNNIIWNKTLVAKYEGQEANGIFICPAGLNWDTKNNAIYATEAPINSRSSVLVKRQHNGVHPSSNGDRQIGDGLWAFLKCTA